MDKLAFKTFNFKTKNYCILGPKLLTIIACCLSTNSIIAQTLEGLVEDLESKPIAYANVLLLNADESVLIKGCLTDETGKFSINNIKKGNYKLKLSYLGFQTIEKEIVIDNKTHSLGTITMKESAEELSEVVIKTEKPLLEHKTDRLIVNIKNSVTSVGNHALSVLERSPGVAIERATNSISMNGKKGVLILIDGKVTRQPLSAIIQMLEGMSTQNIDRIELISNPPAKYQASGNGGIIDIRLVKNENYGTHGNVSIMIGYGQNLKKEFIMNLNNRKNKVNVYSNLSISRNHFKEKWTNDRMVNLPTDTLIAMTVSNREPITTHLNGNLGLDYNINNRLVAGVSVSGYYNEWAMDADNNGFQKSNLNPDIFYLTHTTEINAWSNIISNFNIQYKPSSKSTLNLDMDYLHYYNNNPTTYLNNSYNEANTLDSIQNVKASKKTPIHIWAGRMDYETNLNENIKIETGTDMAFYDLDNEVDIQEEIGSNFVGNEELSEFSELKERITGIYTSVNYKINDNTELKAGLRYEHTLTYLNSQKKGQILDMSYGYFFPTFYCSKTLTEKSALSFSYGKRITRPAYNDLAPFVIFLDPNTYFFGNTALQPAISNNLNLNYQWKKTIIALQYGNEKNAIINWQPIVLDNGKQVFTSVNLDYRDTYSLSIAQRHSLFEWWSGNLNVLGVAQKIRIDEAQVIKSKYLLVSGNETFNFTDNLTLEISGYFQTKISDGLTTIRETGNLTFGLHKKFNNHNKLGLTFDRVFGQVWGNYTSKALQVNYIAAANYIHEPRIIKLTYSFTFGNEKLKGERKQSKTIEEIKSRVN
ncbi:outer membrane beta-barrel protein [Aestuariivivens sediminis]|uniref:outer membrane beta-barrel protein n=1 Tax=Aestuariivivens sediminis TaxID=2913557 RepID=UPI001F569139|nr:outer membrane beta-barrel protein [Aestuariivivens sediminis]